MKKILLTVLTSITLLTVPVMAVPVITVQANSLDEVLNESTQENSATDNTQTQTSDNSNNSNNSNNSSSSSSIPTSGDQYMNDIKSATDLSQVDTAGASKVNEGIRTVAAWIVKVLSYGLTALLVVRILLDLIYIALPFSRSILSNGYEGNPGAGGMQQPGMGGMGGMGGMNGMGGMGGYGMNRMGMGGMGMNRMGMGGMGGMGMQGQGQMGASPAMGRIQWVSTAALNAAEAEKMPGPDGRPQNAYKVYAKDMFVVLVITPILLTLAVTGVLTNLGFLIGDVIARGIANIGNMM